MPVPLPPKGGISETQNGRFPPEVHFILRKSATNFLFCEYCQRQSYKVFTGLFIGAKMVGADVPLYVKIWPKLTHPSKTPISSQYSLVALQP